jgi:uridine phosphorylase
VSVDLLFIAAEPRECSPFVQHWHDVSDPHLPVHWARAGKWKARNCLVIANGAGVQRAARAMEAAPQAAAVCSTGFCGALDSTLKIGDIFLATEVRNGTGSWAVVQPAAPPAATGTLQTAGAIVGSQDQKRKLFESGGAAVEMEASAVARASQQRGVPFYCIRAVSDLAEETFLNDFNACLLPDGRFDTLRLVRGAILSPRRMRELIRLARRTTLAANNLGDYLDRCDF